MITEVSKEYTASVFSIEAFILKKEKGSYSETLKSWPFQTPITSTSTIRESRVE
jgi:hypothetical protein